VILVDLHMPDDYGLTAAFIKSQLQLTGSPIVAMSLSGEDHEESRRLAESVGAVTLLDKARFGNELIPAIMRLAGSASNPVRPARHVVEAPNNHATP
jgi:CheY-like chemotaxis protein